MKLSTKITVGFLFIVGVVLLFVIVCGETNGETIIVAQDGSGNFTTIQDAIDNATVDDTIRVWGGTYYENIAIDKTINLTGNGSGTTTIDGGGSGDVVRITEDWVNLSGFKITGSKKGDQYAGLKITSYENSIFSNNCSNNQNGIYLEDANNSTIENNTCSSNSGNGIYLRDSKN